ncbi:hypothetical protein EMB92_06135 [Bifidobacterium callitrichos]|uniref:Uncharacterized protein n=1 Tax=Bifidobacterium callitrichos TaxID=762209 RepID=A0A5M9ZCS0_9BIFI|nr:hypothetical protein [Bifidobacterium callitrichos]KAA8816481.1 hypothetical protein EMB92_06135 [Bifidobacterium callitrichos]
MNNFIMHLLIVVKTFVQFDSAVYDVLHEADSFLSAPSVHTFIVFAVAVYCLIATVRELLQEARRTFDKFVASPPGEQEKTRETED